MPLPVTMLADLLKPLTTSQLADKLFAALNSQGFPVADYTKGTMGEILVSALYSQGLGDVSKLVSTIAASGFTSTAEADVDNPEWLRLLAKEFFQIDWAPATHTKQRCRVWCQVGTGPYNLSPGQLVAVASSGRRYVNTEAATIPEGTIASGPTGAYVDMEFQAESPGAAYNGDTAGTITTLVNALPGLNVQNTQPAIGSTDGIGDAQKSGQGTGRITPSSSGAVLAQRRYVVSVLTNGNVGSGAVQVGYLDDGAVVPVAIDLTPIPASYSPGDNVVLTFHNGAGNPSFIAGNHYSFSTPGSSLVQQGTDDESNAALAARARGRFPSLATIATDDKFVGWVKQCSIDQQLGVTRITVGPSSTVAGDVVVTIAGPAGPPPGATVTAVQSYINERLGVMETCSVIGATAKNVSATGTVRVRAAQLVKAQAAADANWDAFLATIPIGGDPRIGRALPLSELVQALTDAGVLTADLSDTTPDGLRLNGAAADVVLGPTDIPVKVSTLRDSLVWLPV